MSRRVAITGMGGLTALGHDWPTIGRIGNLMGALKVCHHGTQNQKFSWDDFSAEFQRQFGYSI